MMSRRYVEALLSGRKRATVRPGRLRPARVLYIHSGGRVVARARVASVVHTTFRMLGRREAEAEGLSSPEELKAELRRIYPRIGDGTPVTVIFFAEVEPVDMPEHGYGAAPAEVARRALLLLPDLDPQERRILEAVARRGSIRGAAAELYGDPEERHRIRAVLRRAAERLSAGPQAGGPTQQP